MTPGEPRFAGSGRRQEAAIEGLTAAVSRLRRGVSALRAENHELRLELAELRTGEREAEHEDAVAHDFGELVNIAIPAARRRPAPRGPSSPTTSARWSSRACSRTRSC